MADDRDGRFGVRQMTGSDRPGHPGADAADFRAANRERVRASAERLERLCPGGALAERLTGSDTGSVTPRPLGWSAEEVSDVWSRLDELFVSHSLPGGTMAFTDGGRVGAPPGSVRSEHAAMWPPGVVAGALRRGQTVVLHGLSRMLTGPVREACEALEAVLGTPVDVNAYVSAGERAGFDPHWDDHDTLIVSVLGRKEWAIHEAVAPHATRSTVGPTVSGPVVDRFDLSVGQWIHVPRGVGHSPRPTGELTAHLTFQLERPQLDRAILHWASSFASIDGAGRHIDSGAEPLPPALRRQLSWLGDGGDAMRAAYLAWRRATTPARAGGTPGASIAAWSGLGGGRDVQCRLATPGGVMILDGTGEPAVAGWVIEADSPARALLAAIADGGWHSMTELAARFPTAAAPLLGALDSIGLIALRAHDQRKAADV